MVSCFCLDPLFQFKVCRPHMYVVPLPSLPTYYTPTNIDYLLGSREKNTMSNNNLDSPASQKLPSIHCAAPWTVVFIHLALEQN